MVLHSSPVTPFALVWSLIASSCASSRVAPSLDDPALCQSSAEVEVAWPARLYLARVIRDQSEDGTCEVEYLEPGRRWYERVARSRLYRDASGGRSAACEPGDEVWVDWPATQWHPAIVQGKLDDDNRCPVRYRHLSEAWDESVELARIREVVRHRP